MKDLFSYLQENPLPWLRLNEAGELEFVIDNHLLSTYRSCPSYFFEYALRGLHRKSAGGDVTREWALDFGILFHKMMEVYYKTFRSPEFKLEEFAIDAANKYWHEMKMDVHLQHKECQQMGGIFGFAGMLIQYATQYKAENEHIKILANEVSFGRNHEVIIGSLSYYLDDDWHRVRVYLSGRLDIIADDGYFIFPLDHITMGSFRGDPMARFLLDDGPTGYVFALNAVLPSIVPEELRLKRECNRIQMNLISKAVPKEGSRFKRFTLYKTQEQLDAYRQRMLGTCHHILTDLKAWLSGASVVRDTSKCQNWYFKQCPYYDIHRQADKAGEEATIRNGYIQLPIWDTENVVPLEE